MGAALYIALEREIPGFDPFVNGKALSAAADSLHALANALGVRRLMEFFSADPETLAEFLDADAEVPPQVWFPAAAGLVTVRGLRAHLAAHPTAVSQSEAVLADLADFERVLATADEHGVAWCLRVDF